MKLKYNTHIILVTDNAIDKLFRDTETLIGSSKPKPEGAVFVFFHPKKQDLVIGNESKPKKLLVPLRDNYYMSFFTEGDSDPSVEKKRKYAVMTNLEPEPDSAALDSNFR